MIAPPSLVVYGDFNCPWSYLAFRRASLLAADGLPVEWRAVEHDPRRPVPTSLSSARFDGLHEEMDRVLALLLPGERLPYDLAGFVPWTDAAVAAYAEAHVAQVGARVRRVLFEAFWMHGIDIGDAKVLRTLLVDELRGSRSPAEAVREWGYPVDVTGGPLSTPAWRAVARWREAWLGHGKQVVPVVQEPGSPALHGVDAVEWLGRQVLARGLDPDPAGDPAPEPATGQRGLPDLGWTAAVGGPWLPRRQRSWAAARLASSR